jgi:hypothetical protein
MLGSEAKLLFAQKPEFVYFPDDPREQDIPKEFANSVEETYGSVG